MFVKLRPVAGVPRQEPKRVPQVGVPSRPQRTQVPREPRSVSRDRRSGSVSAAGCTAVCDSTLRWNPSRKGRLPNAGLPCALDAVPLRGGVRHSL
jgi:hypothetical protein